jgi:large subunit ribosomal protein L19e
MKDQMDLSRAKNKAARERRQARVDAKRNALTGEDDLEAEKKEEA